MAWSVVLGQSTAITMLRAHLRKERVGGAYLFAGPSGIGKRLAALEFAKALECEQGGDEACDRCRGCSQAARGVHPDLHSLSPQGALNLIRIEDVRALQAAISLRPFSGCRHVAIVDGAERLTEDAANSFLKALEEPSAQVCFVLLTEAPERCLATIRSRCQLIRFHRLPQAAIDTLLRRHEDVPPDRMDIISRLAQGRMDAAVSLAKEWDRRAELAAQLGREEPLAWISWRAPSERRELSMWLNGSVEWLRDVLAASIGADELVRHQEALPAIQRHAGRFDREACLAAIERYARLEASLEQLVSPKMVAALLRQEWIQLLTKDSS